MRAATSRLTPAPCPLALTPLLTRWDGSGNCSRYYLHTGLALASDRPGHLPTECGRVLAPIRPGYRYMTCLCVVGALASLAPRAQQRCCRQPGSAACPSPIEGPAGDCARKEIPSADCGPWYTWGVHSMASLWLGGPNHGSVRKAGTAPSAVAGPTPTLTGMEVVIESCHIGERWLI